VPFDKPVTVIKVFPEVDDATRLNEHDDEVPRHIYT